MESLCEQNFSNLVIDSQLDFALDFDWAILNYSIVTLVICFWLLLLQEGDPLTVSSSEYFLL